MSKLVTNREDAHTIALREDEARIILDCGHRATPDFFLVADHAAYADTPGQGVSGTPGYATVAATGERICYADADKRARADLSAAGAEGQPFGGGYISSDDSMITTWTGGKLARITRTGVSRSGFNGSEIHSYRATDRDGRVWYGRNGGPGMTITLRPSKRL